MIQHLTSTPAFEVRQVCQALDVAPSSFYAHAHKPERPRCQHDRILGEAMKRSFEESQHTYGSPRLVKALRQQGLHTSKTRVRRLMQTHGLCPKQKRRVRLKTTLSNPHLPIAPHRLLEAPPATKPGQRLYSDITYIPTQEGWRRPKGTRLAATLDAYSRRCAGWSAGDNMETPLVLRAAQWALSGAGATAGLDVVFHSDRGSQYASEMFRRFLAQQGVVQSMSRKGRVPFGRRYDNAAMESFWATLKTECFDNFRHGIPATRQEAVAQIFRYIELFYNPKRLHSALGYKSPIQFEQTYFTQKEMNPLL